MANKNEVVEGAKFKTSTGRIGTAYAVTTKKVDNGMVDLQFEDGPFCLVSGPDYKPSHSCCYIEQLELVK